MTPQDMESFEGARIKVIGVGGGGGNAIGAMLQDGLSGIDFIAMNTDVQALSRSAAERRFQLGTQLTRGLGAGANPEVGREAALADRERVSELVHGADMVFVVAGMGGGTGTGAAPVVAEICRESGALTVGVATLPFDFEGRRRRRQAEEGLATLARHVDTLITVPNQRLMGMVDEATTMHDAFRMVDRVVMQAVKGVADLVRNEGTVNVDFADIRTIMENKGPALLATGVGRGSHRTVEAAQRAFNSPLIADASLIGARQILLNITGPPNLSLHEINEASTLILDEAHEDVNLIWGWVVDESMGEEVRVTLIATGYDDVDPVQLARQAPTVRTPRRRNPEAPPANSGAARPRVPRNRSANPRRSGSQLDGYDLPTFFKTSD